MNQDKALLGLELRLLIARHGKARVSEVLSSIEDVDIPALDSDVKTYEEGRPRRRTARPRPRKSVDEMIREANPENPMPNASSGSLRLRTRTNDSCPGFERSSVSWSPGVYRPRNSVPARTPCRPSSGCLHGPIPTNWQRSMRETMLAAVISESSPVRYWATAAVPAPACNHRRVSLLVGGCPGLGSTDRRALAD